MIKQQNCNGIMYIWNMDSFELIVSIRLCLTLSSMFDCGLSSFSHTKCQVPEVFKNTPRSSLHGRLSELNASK